MYKFVVADDAAFMRKLLTDILNAEDDFMVVAEATTGIEAIEMAKRFKPDVITLDITMPELSGIDAIKEIKRVSPDSVILMVTAVGHKDAVIEAVRYGARDFIVKPFEKERVLESIRKNLS